MLSAYANGKDDSACRTLFCREEERSLFRPDELLHLSEELRTRMRSPIVACAHCVSVDSTHTHTHTHLVVVEEHLGRPHTRTHTHTVASERLRIPAC
jgi:hypothetical protein